MELEAHDLARLRSQASRGELILFTGAGFSFGAEDHSGHPVPSVNELKQELWQLCYPGETYDASSSIGDLYGAAMRQKKSELSNLLQSRLTVAPDTLPEYYLSLFNFPWFRCYTLNVDDLESAVGRRFTLQRPPITISARSGEAEHLPGLPPSSQGLEVVHLNGVVPSLRAYSSEREMKRSVLGCDVRGSSI